jgi:hypothetical protein
MQPLLNLEIGLEHRPFFQTMALVNRRTEDVLDAETLELLKHFFSNVYKYNRDTIREKKWKNSDSILEVFDHIMLHFNKKPMYEGYRFVSCTKIDGQQPHSFPLQLRIVDVQHNNLIIPLNWIIKQQKNESLFDSLVMAFHHLYKVVGEKRSDDDMRLEHFYEELMNQPKAFPKELLRRTDMWYKPKKNDPGKYKAGEFLDDIREHPEKLLHNSSNAKLDSESVKRRLLNKIEKMKDIDLYKIIRDLISLLDVCRFNTTVGEHTSIMDFDISYGFPNLATDLSEFIFDPYDLYGTYIIEGMDSVNHNIGSVGYCYVSNLLFPKPESYFDSGFLEEYIEKTQKLQISIHGLYKRQIYQHDKCPEWF